MAKQKEEAKDPEAIDTFLLKFSGKAEAPHPLVVSNNVKVTAEGSIDSEVKSDNHDGSFTYIWTFKPIRIELLDELGESIKMKDTRSNSQLIRALVYKRWVNAASKLSFEEYYDRVAGAIMVNIDRIIDMANVD